MASRPRGTTHETVLNSTAAERLRELGLEAQSEQAVVDGKGKRHQIDILVELDDDVVAIEAEFAPGRTVREDATKRLPPRPLYWRGLPIRSAMTLTYPAEWQRQPESASKKALPACATLTFAKGERQARDTTAPNDMFDEDEAKIEWGTVQTGGLDAVAEILHDFWVASSRNELIGEIVDQASRAIETAANILSRANLWKSQKDDDTPATCALIWLNALLFQELLANDLDTDRLPEPHRGKRIPRPDAQTRPAGLIRQWDEILKINWWPIFEVARQTLSQVPSPRDADALEILKPCAKEMAERRLIRRHDVAGRIFHRLLNSRKFLATNYTTIPAAVMLAGLAFDERQGTWTRTRWDDPKSVGRLRIVDPACGTGTLLMAAVQEILKRSRRSGASDKPQRAVVKAALEGTMRGYDVVPSAVHLTAATLSMAETRQMLKDMPLFLMAHDVKGKVARLGSLDFLERAPNHKQVRAQDMFPDAERDSSRTTGTGEKRHDVNLPSDGCDLIICNPPYTRAGGPGSKENTDWNPLFGSVLSKKDAAKMQNALRRLLTPTPASLYAGLGSAFVVLADAAVKLGGRLALVLPATALTGSRWASIRTRLLERYAIEWVIVSHDSRYRSKTRTLPGRRFVAFSESTRIAETLIIATRRTDRDEHERTRFVNLRRTPDEPIEALAITRMLLSRTERRVRKNESVWAEALEAPSRNWGETVTVKQSRLGADAWAYAAFIQVRIAEAAIGLRDAGQLGDCEITMTRLGKLCRLGPAEMQIKNENQGLFDISETADPTVYGEPALWHHSAQAIRTLETCANARLRPKADRGAEEQQAMLDEAGRLHIARELGHAPQRLAAVCTDESMLGVRSWITLNLNARDEGAEKTLCLWLNSTAGLVMRLIHANRPYLGRTGLPHELAETMPVLDVSKLSASQRTAGRKIFDDLRNRILKGFGEIDEDEVRIELDERLWTEVLKAPDTTAVKKLRKALAREPTMSARH